MKQIQSMTETVTQIMAVIHGVTAAVIAGVGLGALAAPELIRKLVVQGEAGDSVDLSVYGFGVTVPVEQGGPDLLTLGLFCIGAALILGTTALVFRKLHQVIRNAGESTPFREDNLRLLRQIGWLSILIPVIGLVMSIVCRLAVGVESAETSVNLFGLSMGILVLCLTQFFAHGVELERDVEGLL